MKMLLIGLFCILLLVPSHVHAAYWNGTYYDNEPTFPMAFDTVYNVNLRTEPTTDSARLIVVPRGTRVYVTGFTCENWYAVTFGGMNGYMSSEFLAATDAPITNTAPAFPLPFVTTDRLNLRAEPNRSASVHRTVDRDTRVYVTGVYSDEWFAVTYNNIAGYMSSEFLVSENAVVPAFMTLATTYTAAEVVAESAFPRTYITNGNGVRLRTVPSTEGNIIRNVPINNRVYVTAVVNAEWLAVTHNGTPGYMASQWLRPCDGNVVHTNVGAIELLDWWTEARPLMRTGMAVTIIDVRTGIRYQVASFSNGNHADVEPITAHDTAEMLRAFGGRWCWQPRPVLVVLPCGRTLAASINGMPHAGWTNNNNNMNGHVCLHFLNSRTHNGNRSHERDHQNAVQEAFNTASRW